MKRPSSLFIALLAPFVLAWSLTAEATGNCQNGKTMYNKTNANVPTACSNSSCHGTGVDLHNIQNAAGNPALIGEALDGTNPDIANAEMTALDLRNTLPLTSSDIDDIATYIFFAPTCPAAAPIVGAAPTSLAFGNVTVGSTSGPQTITVSNTGTGGASGMTYPAAPANFTKSGTCANGALAAGGNCQLVFTYTPSAAASDNPTYTITGNGGISIPISLSGTGVALAPNLQASQGSVSFGSLLVGQTSSATLITITNTGGGAAAGIAISNPDATEFLVTSNSCGATLAAAASCSFNLAYKPSAAGADNVTLSINYTGGTAVSIGMSGTGTSPPPASLQATPTNVPFGSVTVGATSSTHPVQISNTGGSSATAVGIVNSNGTEFPVSGNSCGPTLAAGASCNLNVAYRPSAAGSDNATLTVNYSGGSPVQVTLSGTGTAAAVANLQASPGSLAFGSVTAGTTSGTQSLTISNTGGAGATGVSLANSNSAEFVVSANTCGATLAAGASCTLNVAYAPTAAGADNASLTVSYAGGSNVVVTLSGTGSAVPVASLQAAPAVLAFGSVTAGTTSGTQTVTVSNTGTAGATGVGIANSNAAEFPVSANTCAATLAAGASCTLNVAYAPSAAGGDNATLTISYAGGTNVVVNLSGTGTAVAVANVQVSPSSLAFGSVTVGATSGSQTVTITNSGSAGATGLAIANGNTAEFIAGANTCGATLAAAASCSVTLAYKPSATGADNTTLTVSYAGGTSLVVNLSGTGAAAAVANLQVAPASLAFGSVTAGTTSGAQTVTITNTGGAGATGLGFAGTNSAEFPVSANTCGGTLAAGASCSLNVAYAPTGPGADSATLTFTYVGGAPLVVNLSGTGTSVPVANLQVAPASLGFGSVTAGTSSSAQTLTVTNSGSAGATGVGLANSNAARFVVSANTCGGALAAGASCTLNVAYAPVAAGSDNATITISYAGGTNIVVNLSGTGTSAPVASLQASPPLAVFGNVAVGQASAATAFTLTNNGGAAAAGVAFANSNGAEFIVSGNSCGASLAPGSACGFNVAYQPSAAGADIATLTITYAGGGAVSISLTGTGTGGTASAGQLSMPSAITMADQTVGTASLPRTVTVSNIGGSAVTVTSITSSNAAEFAVGGVTCGSVSAGGACTFAITFQPSAGGGRTATITVASNGTGAPQSILVNGNGVTTSTPTTVDIIEYHHAAWDHYFITSIADEITKLDNGTFAGWTRTGYKFKSYPLNTAGSSTVCRFFSTSFSPRSSHFYTPLVKECADVKTNPDWQFEGEVFNIPIPALDGTCPSGTLPVYRLYNNGQGAAPNHRYTTDPSVRAQMMLTGWMPEGYGNLGVMMCAPQ